MLNNSLNVIWTSDLTDKEAKRIIRSKASALGWIGRGPNCEFVKHLQVCSNFADSQIARRRQWRAQSLAPRLQVRTLEGHQIAVFEQDRHTIPPPVPVFEPHDRLLPTFMPRFESLLGPDTQQIVALSHQNEMLREAYDCLVVGVSSNLRFDAELRSSAIQRYGALLPKVQARVNSMKDADNASTLSLIFLLAIQEAMVWKVRTRSLPVQ